LFERTYVVNAVVDDQCEAKKSADVARDSRGISIRLFLLSIEKRRFKSPLYIMIANANSKPVISKVTSIVEGMAKLNPIWEVLKGQNIMTLPINKSPKAKCCTTATK